MAYFDTIKSEVISQMALIVPVCMSFVFRKSIDLVSVVYVGMLGPRYLAASGLATVTANVTGNSMIIGLAGALSTQCSQLSGSKNDKLINVILPRAILIVFIVINVPVSIIWFRSEAILTTLGQSQQLANDSSIFLLWLLPGVWALTCSTCIQNWLHSQSKTKFVLIITVITALLHPLFCYLFIFQFSLGFRGNNDYVFNS